MDSSTILKVNNRPDACIRKIVPSMRKRRRSIVLIDGHPLYCDGFLKVSEELFIIEKFHSFHSVQDVCFPTLHALNDPLIIIDIRSIDGAILEFLINLRLASLKFKIIIYTDSDNLDFIKKCFLFGADGFILKSSPVSIIKEAIFAIDKGKKWIPISVFQSPPNSSKNHQDKSKIIHLSHRELHTLKYILLGMKNSDIAKSLGIRENTVKSHVSSSLKKFKVSNRTRIIHECLNFESALSCLDCFTDKPVS